jgi:hypothetical protein
MGSRGTAAPPPRPLAHASALRRRRDPLSRAGVAIERYATPFDICKAFYKVRLETYAKRKVRDAASVSRRLRRDSRVDGV